MNKKQFMQLIEHKEEFRMDTGSPSPFVVSSDTELMVFFYTDEEPYCCVVKFTRGIHHKFGTPSSETIHGHPYHRLGLESYGFYELLESDYIMQMRIINEVHEQFDLETWKNYKHFIITFHDTMFECIATGYSISDVNLEAYNKYLSAINGVVSDTE